MNKKKDATQLNVSLTQNDSLAISEVNSTRSNKTISNNNKSKMLKVIQHIYIMPSSVWAEAWLHPNNFSILGPYMMIFLHFVD